ncbi:hypothetical protein Dimus_036466, partial [Dionaea muscipula]
RQKWENLFKRRELVHIDAVKEFYAKMTVIHLKKKDIVKSKVRGIEMEFDHEKLATILGVPGANGICEYIKEVWEESKYTKPLEITRRFANDENIMAARRRKMQKRKKKGIRMTLIGKSSLMRQAVEGNAGREKSFMMLEEEAQGSPDPHDKIPSEAPPSSTRQKDKGIAGVDPRVMLWRETDLTKFRASLKGKGQTDFMMIWRRPKLRMPDF